MKSATTAKPNPQAETQPTKPKRTHGGYRKNSGGKLKRLVLYPSPEALRALAKMSKEMKIPLHNIADLLLEKAVLPHLLLAGGVR